MVVGLLAALLTHNATHQAWFSSRSVAGAFGDHDDSIHVAMRALEITLRFELDVRFVRCGTPLREILQAGGEFD